MIGGVDLWNSSGWLLLAQAAGSFWMPGEASTTAPGVDRVFYLILAVCAFFYFLVVGLTVLFAVRYRRRPGVKPVKTASQNMALEIAWTALPLVIVGVIFYRGFAAYMDMQTIPSGCYEIRVSARQWAWQFQYPNGYWDENLHVPVDTPVKLTMTSEDVIHSLWIPAFRVKMDLVPGRYTATWFHAVNTGTYELLCTEYCGNDHSNMLAKVVVHPPGKFEEWLKGAANYEGLEPAQIGEILYRKRGCAQCHSIDGKANTGPTFKGIWGESHVMADGSSVKVEDNYVRESILDPQAKVRGGFQPVMSPYQGQISDGEITALIEFIKSISKSTDPSQDE